ncbi:hypothetical protein BCR32DRAFT_291727 [Anaeromyces robustus]|uniref:Uncharacterized protein n=1 Tax=Anaeromyces robustus TaxID=1754192 RepID=A0A1Y1XDG7_9FUNG|nr:hypothetical protein BCR32DRAFT_291727 [Anaeromyces robustus]|eukprot:ORX83831.1 hypothetical protein BCR32DRAFT_291727 [Anaeromyces robustus]
MLFIFSIQYFILLLITISSISLANHISISSVIGISETTLYNYTVLNSLRETKFCNNSDECYDYSECSSEGHVNNRHCIFHGFYCDGEGGLCTFFNKDKYDYLREKPKNNFKEDIILKTCHLKLFEQGKCKTNTCSRVFNCVSKNCYKSNCVTNGTIYQCMGKQTDYNDKKYMTCGKALNMECNSDEECFGKETECIDGFCVYEPNKSFFTGTTISIMLIALIVGFYLIYLLYKRKDNFSELPEN